MEFKVPCNAYSVSTRPSPGTDVLGGILYLTCFCQQNTLYKWSHTNTNNCQSSAPLVMCLRVARVSPQVNLSLPSGGKSTKSRAGRCHDHPVSGDRLGRDHRVRRVLRVHYPYQERVFTLDECLSRHSAASGKSPNQSTHLFRYIIQHSTSFETFATSSTRWVVVFCILIFKCL